MKLVAAKDAIVLCNHLIQELERLSSGSLTKEEFAQEVTRSGAIIEIAGKIMENWKKW
jgi:hypothetical protein